jgi:regulatory protein
VERLDDDAPLARVTYLPGVTPRADEDRSGRSDDPAPLTEAEWAAPGSGWTDAPAPGAAHTVSITALARRGLSRRELERHLRDRQFDEHDIADELARLERDGYVDDIALAQNLVGTLQERKGLGRSAIAAELTRRLLTPAAIEYALELIDTSDELSRARDLALKRATQLRGLDRDTAVRRLSAYLARRGYGGSTIRAAVDQALPPRTAGGVAFR